MAPRRPTSTTKKKKKAPSTQPLPTINIPTADVRIFLTQSTISLQQSDPLTATTLAKKALTIARGVGEGELAALTLLGEASLETGDVASARKYFIRAATLDPEGKGNDPRLSFTRDEDRVLFLGGGPETFLWLAQLSEEGGADSVAWFDKGAMALRRQIEILEGFPAPARTPARQREARGKRRKLCEVLCAVAEVYMTDLSWEEDAEERCEKLVTEAAMVCPSSAEALQTLANVRISQGRTDEARAALRRSMEIWQKAADAVEGRDEGVDGKEGETVVGDEDEVPDFATRISLVRLLVEVDMVEEAITVTNRLQLEDDQSVEAAYLGGWARYLRGNNIKEANDKSKEEEWQGHWRGARRSLTRCMKLYQMFEYEDEQLGQHAAETIEDITKVLGPMEEGEEDEVDSGEDAWEDDEDSDEEMT